METIDEVFVFICSELAIWLSFRWDQRAIGLVSNCWLEKPRREWQTTSFHSEGAEFGHPDGVLSPFFH
jgi:hypothetical protein